MHRIFVVCNKTIFGLNRTLQKKKNKPFIFNRLSLRFFVTKNKNSFLPLKGTLSPALLAFRGESSKKRIVNNSGWGHFFSSHCDAALCSPLRAAAEKEWVKFVSIVGNYGGLKTKTPARCGIQRGHFSESCRGGSPNANRAKTPVKSTLITCW